MQVEYRQAVDERAKARAFWIRLHGYSSFWKALGFYTVMKNLAAIWKISRPG
jgi:hypothetical protein